MRIMSKHPFSRRVVKQKVTETARVDENRAGVEVVEETTFLTPDAEVVAGMMKEAKTLPWPDCIVGGCRCHEDQICDECLDATRRAEFDAMSPAAQAIQILAGADPDGVIRCRIAQENSRKLAKALDDARAFQAGHRYE
jgi:hypothetical protein